MSTTRRRSSSGLSPARGRPSNASKLAASKEEEESTRKEDVAATVVHQSHVRSRSHLLRTFGYGIAFWVSVAFFVGPIMKLKETDLILFKAVVGLAATFFIELFIIMYFKDERHSTVHSYFRRGVIAGLIWIAEAVVLDNILIHFGVMPYPNFHAYISDIGLNLVNILTMTSATGFLLDLKHR